MLGQLRVALLVYALGSPVAGAATSLAVSTAGTLIGTVRHARDGRVSLWLLLSVGGPSALAAFATARWAGGLDPRALKAAIAGVLLLSGAAMLRPRPAPGGPEGHVPSRTFAVLAEVVVGAVLGAISAVAVGLEGAVWRRGADGVWTEDLDAPTTPLEYHAVYVDPDGGVWAVGGRVYTGNLSDGLLTHYGPPLLPPA